MTDERNTIDSGADTDAVVTQAYRDTTDERTPDALNRAILDQAARTAQPRYSRIRLWTRPLAWAATVMLSVAIVLQLTQVPAPNEIGFDEESYEVDAPADIPAERLEEVTDAALKTEALRSTAKQIGPSAASETRQREQPSKATIVEQGLVEQGLAEQEPAARALTSPDAASLELKDQDILQRADDMARLREGSIQLESAGVANAFAVPDRCDETATATPETWLQCIRSLEEAGLTDVAAEERELLITAFPDFETP